METDASKREEPGCLRSIGVLGLTFALGFFVAALRALVARELWTWFVAPTWGLAVPSLATLYGVTLLLQMLVWHSPRLKNETLEREAHQRPIRFVLTLWTEQAALAGVSWCIGRVLLEVCGGQ